MTPAPPPPLLSLRSLKLRFGGVVALDGVDLDLAGGELAAVIGPNGAGKTTLFNCIGGLYRPDAGAILLDGSPITHWPPHRIAARGVGRSFQSPAVFASLDVLDNLMVGAHTRSHAGFWAGALRTPAARREEADLRERAFALAGELGLADQARRPAGTLPLALRKRVDLGRALAGEPRLLLLDEPAAGLDAAERDALAALLRRLRDRRRLTVLLVEHHMGFVSALCDHLVVLDFGRKIAEGAPDAVRARPEVREAYLGAATDA